MNFEPVKEHLKDHWKKYGVAAAFAGIAGYQYMQPEPTAEDQAAQDQIHMLEYPLIQDTKDNCSSSNTMDAIEVIKDSYDTPQEVAEVMAFLNDQKIKLVANNTYAFSYVDAVFYNNPETDMRVLALRNQDFISSVFGAEDTHPEQLRSLINKMREGDILNQRGTHVMFENKYIGEDLVFDYRYLPNSFTLGDTSIEGQIGIENTQLAINEETWGNPCTDAPKEAPIVAPVDKFDLVCDDKANFKGCVFTPSAPTQG